MRKNVNAQDSWTLLDGMVWTEDGMLVPEPRRTRNGRRPQASKARRAASARSL